MGVSWKIEFPLTHRLTHSGAVDIGFAGLYCLLRGDKMTDGEWESLKRYVEQWPGNGPTLG